MKNVLILVTNHATLGTTSEPNGTYAPELTHALNVFIQSGIGYEIASIQGGAAPLYGTDIADDEVNRQILADEEFVSKINNTIPSSQIDMSRFDAVFYPGGFGLLSDLAEHEATAALVAKFYENNGVIGAVCHGPAGLLPITLSNGKKLIANKAVTGFTREEEIDFGTIDNIPFLLEESLSRSAAQYRKVQPWGEHIVEDERLVTGQNPASAHAVGKAIVEMIK